MTGVEFRRIQDKKEIISSSLGTHGQVLSHVASGYYSLPLVQQLASPGCAPAHTCALRGMLVCHLALPICATYYTRSFLYFLHVNLCCIILTFLQRALLLTSCIQTHPKSTHNKHMQYIYPKIKIRQKHIQTCINSYH